MIRSSIARLAAVVAVGTATIALTGCDLREVLLPRLVSGQQAYLGPDQFTGSELELVTEGVYSFRWEYYRNLVIDTDEGWVVVDPMNKEAARALRGELEALKPGQPVAAMFYSHHHLDHAQGGAPLEAERVIAHRKAPQYWRDFPSTVIAAPTDLIEGDQVYRIGGVEIRLIDLGKSHSDTLYAFHLPEQSVLHTTDMGLVRAFLPMGHPDSYMPGVIRALEKLAAIDFEHFVPSHFGTGKKMHLVEYLGYQKEVRALALQALAEHGDGGGRTIPGNGDTLVAMFNDVYEPIQAKYGHWHGFDQQTFYTVFGAVTGEALGY